MVSSATIGHSVGHVEGFDKVTGRAHYAGDMILPGMLWGKCLRSPFPHARIVSIDVSRARALPGVHTVLTGADLPDRLVGRRIIDMPVLARDRVRFIGEKVAAVAAETPEIAEQALLLIDVEYDELPAVFDATEAIKDDAPRVHAYAGDYAGAHQPVPRTPNVLSQVLQRRGDIEAGFAKADRIFAHTFATPSIHQGYIEPHATMVRVDPANGDVDVWLSNKSPFLARAQIAAAAGIPEDKVRVNLVPIGGDFGGKGSVMDSFVAYHLSAQSGRPVKMVMSYTEELLAGNPRHAMFTTIRTGVTGDGRITARQAKVIFNSGAYGAFKPTPTVNLGGAGLAAGPYRIPAVDIESLMVYTNTVPAGHMRAPGAPQVSFAVESHMDMVAYEMGIDPLEFRLRNALTDGDSAPLGAQYQDIMAKQTLQAAADAAGWDKPRQPNTGLGISFFERPPGGGASNTILSVDRNAQLTLLCVIPDTGTGSHTILQQIIAQELQAPLSSVVVVARDTDVPAPDGGVGGSRVTHAAGQATLTACGEVRQALIELAARILNKSAGQVSLGDGDYVSDDGERLSLAALMQKAGELEEAPISRTGHYTATAAEVTCFSAQVAEVEVDPETGQVKLRRFVSAHDVGTVLNPLTHQGQIDGGVMQGIGQALLEWLHVEDGAVTNVNLGDYKLPTMADIPELVTVLVESNRGPAPYHGKAIGEHVNVPAPAAIANAVFAASGVRLTELPITAERVFAALSRVEDVE